MNFVKITKKNSLRIYCNILLICLVVLSFELSGCRKKVGVKPGGTLKQKTEKCKCKKRKGLYSEVIEEKSTFLYIYQYKPQHHSNMMS